MIELGIISVVGIFTRKTLVKLGKKKEGNMFGVLTVATIIDVVLKTVTV